MDCWTAQELVAALIGDSGTLWHHFCHCGVESKRGRIKSREVPVNKSRKILTMVALAVFGAIILFYYTGWKVIKYESPWVNEEGEATSADISIERSHGNRVTILGGPKTEHYPWGDLELYKVKIEGQGRGFYVGSPAIKDVRMPLFVLGVFYAGFFFLLGEQKPRS
jgi:hypothetical protein